MSVALGDLAALTLPTTPSEPIAEKSYQEVQSSLWATPAIEGSGLSGCEKKIGRSGCERKSTAVVWIAIKMDDERVKVSLCQRCCDNA